MSKVEMLTPENSAIALIDYQPAMYQGVQSHDRLVAVQQRPGSCQGREALQDAHRNFDGRGEGLLLRSLHAGGHRTVPGA